MVVESIAKFLVKILPARPAVRIVRALATRTQRPPITPGQQHALTQASMVRYGENGRNAAWSWGEGPLIIMVHGWNGCAAQLGPLAVHIAGLGFRCVAIDITGHGSSSGNRTGWGYFIEDIAALTQALGQEVYAYVNHSAGGLTMMAARRLRGLRAKRYVCICSPSHPYPPINVVRKKLGPKPSVIAHYQEDIARQFNTDWDTLKGGFAYADAGDNLLLVYDEGDRFVNHHDGDQIQSWCPGAKLVKTRSYGHTKILAAQELLHTVGEFLLNGAAYRNVAHREESVDKAFEHVTVKGG